jgi:hypothetical protein
MSLLSITANLDLNPWDDLKAQAESGQLQFGTVERVGMMPAGMHSGKAAVMIAGTTDEGKPIVLQVSWAMFQMAYAGLSGTPTAQMENL